MMLIRQSGKAISPDVQAELDSLTSKVSKRKVLKPSSRITETLLPKLADLGSSPQTIQTTDLQLQQATEARAIEGYLKRFAKNRTVRAIYKSDNADRFRGDDSPLESASFKTDAGTINIYLDPLNKFFMAVNTQKDTRHEGNTQVARLLAKNDITNQQVQAALQKNLKTRIYAIGVNMK